MLMSSAIALREKCPLVPGAPEDRTELVRELRELTTRLNVQEVLNGWRISLNVVSDRKMKGSAQFLLELDPVAHLLNYTGFTVERAEEASEKYLAREKAISANPHPGAQAVLVSTNSIKSLRSAFPNYYLDTEVFLQALQEAIK